ncbi:F-box protein [Neochlamydia sp. EPS4]|uniref:F-box protein n=1 Tax=Neochlamydia sp. EPS4 TaxID=1478175 RepID=UPI0005D11DAD|nr:F-box protein [Neochlamydia sp. EPS4]
MVNTLANNDNNKNAVSSFPPQLAVSSIEQLPDELLLHIFSFLQASDLLEAELTCHQWKNLAKEEALWKSLYVRYFKVIEPVGETYKESYFRLSKADHHWRKIDELFESFKVCEFGQWDCKYACK